MSATATCTRVAIPRFALRRIQCRRLMSTETASVAPAATAAQAPPPPAPAPAPAVAVAVAAAKKIPTKLSVGDRMHKLLYPNFWEGPDPRALKKKRWVPPKKVKKISERWRDVMSEEKRVSTGLSNSFGIPIYQLTSLNIKKTCPDPIRAVDAAQIALLDPKGARTRLFSRENPERACVGDILLVRQRTGDPFAGVCINIRRQGVDTAILLRGQLTRVGVEMWFKIYSPLVEGIEVVQRAQKRARRARLTYMRKVKHDRGSVENAVRIHLRSKAALGVAEGQRKTGAAKQAAIMAGKKKTQKGRGKKR